MMAVSVGYKYLCTNQPMDAREERAKQVHLFTRKVDIEPLCVCVCVVLIIINSADTDQ